MTRVGIKFSATKWNPTDYHNGKNGQNLTDFNWVKARLWHLVPQIENTVNPIWIFALLIQCVCRQQHWPLSHIVTQLFTTTTTHNLLQFLSISILLPLIQIACEILLTSWQQITTQTQNQKWNSRFILSSNIWEMMTKLQYYWPHSNRLRSTASHLNSICCRFLFICVISWWWWW